MRSKKQFLFIDWFCEEVSFISTKTKKQFSTSLDVLNQHDCILNVKHSVWLRTILFLFKQFTKFLHIHCIIAETSLDDVERVKNVFIVLTILVKSVENSISKDLFFQSWLQSKTFPNRSNNFIDWDVLTFLSLDSLKSSTSQFKCLGQERFVVSLSIHHFRIQLV